MAINGAQNGFVDDRITLPICGMHCSKSKSGTAYTLYIDFFTTAAREKRSYKIVPILTRDPDSLFMRICSAFGVSHTPRVTQLHAAKALALAVAMKGGIKCHRVGKGHDWRDISPVNLDGEKMPWGFPAKEGMRMIDLWVFSPEPPAPEAAPVTLSEEDGVSALLSKMGMGIAQEGGAI